MHMVTIRPISLAIASVVVFASPTFARPLNPGESAVVQSGDAIEDWRLSDDSALRIESGASAGFITDLLGMGGTASLSLNGNAESVWLGRSTLDMDGGKISTATRSISLNLSGGTVRARNAEIRNEMINGRAIVIDKDFPTGVGASAEFEATSIFASSTGMDITDSSATLRNGSHIDAGTGIHMKKANVELFDSTVIARGTGITIESYGVAGSSTLTLENSRVIAGGNVISVASAGGQTSATIAIRNSELVANSAAPGQGNLRVLSVDRGSLLDVEASSSSMTGNLVADGASTLNARLTDGTKLYGSAFSYNGSQLSLALNNGASWQLARSSTIDELNLGEGTVVTLGASDRFNTLTINGDLVSDGGVLSFYTALAGDDSRTDRLVVDGDTAGQAYVHVNNVSGAGAQTAKGIELISVGGASNGQFDLAGRAVGGQYEYFLFKGIGADGNWYLRSQLPTDPDPCNADPSLPDCNPELPGPRPDPEPILRPETGAYLANQFALDQMLRHSYRDRQGGAAAADGIRGWARVDATQSKLGALDDQLDLRVDRSRLQLGADIGVFDDGRGRVGVMGTAARSSATSRSDVTGFSARGKLEGGALGVYGNWANDAMYVDASVQRGQFRNRVQGDGLAEERYDSDIWQSSVEAGYRFDISQIGNTALSLQPELQLIYTDAKTDVHTETNGTVVRAQGNNGLSGRAGLRLQGESRSAAGASVSPYLAANWYRDGAGNGIAFDDEVLKAGIPRNRYELSAGARVEFRSGFSAWGGFGVMRGDSGYREATGNLSVAYSW